MKKEDPFQWVIRTKIFAKYNARDLSGRKKFFCAL